MIIVAGVIVAAVCVAVFWPREKEPVYQGKKLSEWLEIIQTGGGHYGVQRTEAADDAYRAVRAIGTNALPTLLRWVSYREPRWKTFVYEKISKFSPKRRYEWLEDLNPWRTRRPDLIVGTGFAILGQDARPVASELVKIMNNGRSSAASLLAMQALGCIGKSALDDLRTAAPLHDPDPLVRTTASMLLSIAEQQPVPTNGVSGP